MIVKGIGTALGLSGNGGLNREYGQGADIWRGNGTGIRTGLNRDSDMVSIQGIRKGAESGEGI